MRLVPTGIRGLLIGGFLTQFLPAVIAVGASDLTVIPVELNPAGQSGKLNVTGFNKCKNHDHPGCLLFEEDIEGYIKFYIKGEDSARTCSQGAGRVITSIKLTTEELITNQDNEQHSKGNFSAKLEPWLKKNAFKSVDLDTGFIYKAALEDGWTQVVLQNLNNHDAKYGVKQFWYEVSVTSCEIKNGVRGKWVTDPRGDNEGKN